MEIGDGPTSTACTSSRSNVARFGNAGNGRHRSIATTCGVIPQACSSLASSSDEVLISAVATMAEALGITLLGAFRKPVNPTDLADALNSYNVGIYTMDRSFRCG